MSHSSRSKILFVTLALIVLSVGLVAPAFASVHDIPNPLGESATNPNNILDPETNWRRGWGNATTVHYLLKLPVTDPATEGHLRHVHYRFDRSFSEDPVNPGWPRVDMSTVLLGSSQVEIKKDLQSHWFQEPVSAWSYTPMPGQKHPWEGLWSFSYRFEADGPISGESILATPTIGPTILGIDVTSPWPVEKLRAYPSERYSGPAGTWTDSPQAYVFWQDMEYDDLSGTAHFEVQVDGEKRGESVFYLPPTRPYVTVHDMPPGKSTIRVRAVDRATNAGPWRSTTFLSDPDEPELKITRPAKENDLVGARYTFEAQATDLAGIRWVRFFIDGSRVGTVEKAPYQLTLDMTKYANGAHTLTVVTQDMLGRQVSQTRQFNLDKIIPNVLNISDAPDPFYPIIQEGYKDFMTVHFDVTKDVYVNVYFYDSNGELYATRRGPRKAGYANMSWNGQKDEDGSVSTGTFSYRIRVNDHAGNVTWSGFGYTTIRDYEIIRIGPNAVRVIAR